MSTSNGFGSHRLPTLIGLMPPVVVIAIAGVIWPFTIDDAFITFRYARNIAAGHGAVFNPGERIEGFTSPLWLGLASTAEVVGVPPEQMCKVVGIAAIVFLLTWLGWLAAPGFRLINQPDHRDIRNWTRLVAASAVLIVIATHGPLVVGAVSGLETTANAVLIAALFLSAYGGKDWRWPAIWGCLAMLCRPENVLLLGAHATGVWLLQRNRRRQTSLAVASWAMVGGIMFITRYAYYGTWVANTAAAKLGAETTALLGGWHYLKAWLSDYGWLPIVAVAIVAWRRAWRIGLHAGFLVAAQLVFLFVSGGDWMPGYRFLLPAATILFVACHLAIVDPDVQSLQGNSPEFEQGTPRHATIGDQQLPQLLASSIGPRAAGITLCIAMLAIAWQLQSLRVQRWQLQDEVSSLAVLRDGPADYLKRHADPDDILAARDVGLVGYASPCRVLDLVGLTDRHIARTSGFRRREHLDTQYIYSKNPRFILVQSEKRDVGPPVVDRVGTVLTQAPEFGEYRSRGKWDMPHGHFCELFERADGSAYSDMAQIPAYAHDAPMK